MATGITQPGGAGTDIVIFDDADTGGGRPAGPYTFAQISAAFPVDFVDLGTFQKSYRSLVNLRIGDDTTVAATTTLQDINVKVTWDSAQTLTYRASQQSSWFLILGTKCGSGNQAGGANGCDLTFGNDTTLRGTINLYGSKLRKKAIGGRITIATGITGSFGELVDSDVQSDLVYNSYIFGTATQKVANAYNTTFSAPTQTVQGVIGNAFFGNMERIMVSAQNNAAFISTNAQDLAFKDLVCRGTVVFSDFRLNSGAARWTMVRPGWSQSGVPKISLSTAFSITLANALKEYWLYNVKLVDRFGDAVAGISVKLTDFFGNVVVDTVTDSNGRVSFGSGLTQNAIITMDHYGTSGVYIQRHRGPFLEEINMGSGKNPAYFSKSKLFKWPGHETVTSTAGSFEDVNNVAELDSIFNPSDIEEWRPAYA